MASPANSGSSWGSTRSSLRIAIVQRPADEPPLTAIEHALVAMRRRSGKEPQDDPIWLFTNQPRAFEILQKSAPRPLLRFEETIADALLARAEVADDPRTRFDAELVARVAVAVIRSAAIRHRELQSAAPAKAPTLHQALKASFARLRSATEP